MLQDATVVHLSTADKLGAAIRRSLPHIPADAQGLVRSLLHPHSLAIATGTLALWATSHAVGIGQIVDLILIAAGAATVGLCVFEGAAELFQFVTCAQHARTDADLDKAGKHFARAVTVLGISTLQALLLRGQGKTVARRDFPPRIERLPYVGTPPPPGPGLTLWRMPRLPDGSAGITNAYGEIVIARNQVMSEQRATLMHELVHRFFSPRLGPFRQLRAEINMSAYMRSALLRYLEEALAEGYAQLRVYGLASALTAIRFPLQTGYVSVSQLAAEGRAIGTITLGGMLFHVSISPRTLNDDRPQRGH